jgi:hypothetical protein
VDFIANRINLRAGETKNDEAREILIVPPLRVLLKEQLAKREPVCQYVQEFRSNPVTPRRD